MVELQGADGLEGIAIDRPHDGSSELKVDGIFIEIGADPRADIPKELGMNLNDEDRGYRGHGHADERARASSRRAT